MAWPVGPAFCGQPQEQEQFYALFDKSLDLTRSLPRNEPDTRTETPPVSPEIIQEETRWRRITILLIALILLGIAGIWWFGKPSQVEKTNAWYQSCQWLIKAALLILLGFLAWAIARWDQYRRAKAVAELQRLDRAPYLWNPETGTDASAYLSADAQALLTRLRGRSLDERLRLDLPASVLASIRAAGRIQLRYRRQTLPPNFLLLIDRHDAQDHRARLFDALYQVFLRAEAPITRYFYDGDPRLCFNEAHPGGIALSELLHRHAGAQLLLVGDGQGLLSTLSGRVAPWTNLLQAWPRRALLQTRPLGQWARREKELQALLPLLPASPAGLGAAIDLFNSEDPTTLNPEVLKGIPDALQQPFAFAHELIPDLQRHFAQPHIDWIAACALWPTLHWDLTLYLGKVLADRGTGDMGQNDTGAGQARSLLDFAGIRELTRLPWFVEGRMPDAVRSILLEYLQARRLEQPLRLALRTLLEQAPPPPAEATAYDEYRMNLILNELFLQPDATKKRALEREFVRYLAAGKKPDFVALKLLNRPQTPLDVLGDDHLKKYAFRKGLPGLSWQLLPKLLGIWALLGLGLGLVWVQPFANSFETGMIGFILLIANFGFSYRGFNNATFFESYKFDVDRILIDRDFTRLISSGFLHVGWMHLIFNMLSLLAFGNLVEIGLGPLKFGILYLASLLGGNLLALYVHRHHGDYSAVGASGAVCGVIFASIALYPGIGVGAFFLPFYLPSWLYGLLYILISVYGIKAQRDNIGNEAHLGGALTGMLLAVVMEPSVLDENWRTIALVGTSMIAFVLYILIFPDALVLNNFSFKRRNNYYDIDYFYNENRANRQQEMNRLLEKIKRKGMKSLTKKDTDGLDEFSE